MVHTRFASLARAMVIAAVTCAAVLLHHSPRATATAISASDDKKAVLDWRKRDPFDVFLQVYLALAYDPAEAIAMAEDEMVRRGLLEMEGQPPSSGITDWEGSNLHAMILNALIDDGFDSAIAAPLANLAYEQVIGESLSGADMCEVYRLWMWVCDPGEGWRLIEHYETRNECVETYRAAWEDDCGPFPMCRGGTEVRWSEMNISSECPLNKPARGSCVWMRWSEYTSLVWCNQQFYPCECFEEVAAVPPECDVDFECTEPGDHPDDCPCGS